MSAITSASLNQIMNSHEEILKQARNEFLNNEVNDPKDLDLCLQDKYYEIESVYKEIMSRNSSPPVKIIQSKINEKRSGRKLSEVRGYHWDYS